MSVYLMAVVGSSHLNTTGYQFCREFSLTEGAARGTRGHLGLGHASTETTQVYTLLADKVADAEIRAARANASAASRPGRR